MSSENLLGSMLIERLGAYDRRADFLDQQEECLKVEHDVLETRLFDFVGVNQRENIKAKITERSKEGTLSTAGLNEINAMIKQLIDIVTKREEYRKERSSVRLCQKRMMQALMTIDLDILLPSMST